MYKTDVFSDLPFFPVLFLELTLFSAVQLLCKQEVTQFSQQGTSYEGSLFLLSLFKNMTLCSVVQPAISTVP